MSRAEQRKKVGRQYPPSSVQSARQKVEMRAWDLNAPKQFVRRYGWLEVIKEYIKSCREDGHTEPWKYLTLPGPNASDIGFLIKEKVLERTAAGILNVAICDVDNGDNVAFNLAPWGGVIASSSKLLHLELRAQGGAFDNYFPFDVINMDLCNCLYHVMKEDNLVSLKSIFRKQLGARFLLLLTSNPVDLAKDDVTGRIGWSCTA